MPNVEQVREFLQQLQLQICTRLESVDGGGRFKADTWTREAGGGGQSRVMKNGAAFEQAGVNYSLVQGAQLPPSASAARPELEGRGFQAMGLSIVIHPWNPYVPTTHCNIRFFLAEKTNEPAVWWFGGGYDLTPFYGFEEDIRHWHGTAKGACELYGEETYSRFKHWCDEYFYLPHRKEPRGVGGLFFDDLNDWGFDRCFAFWKGVGESFCDAYLPIVKRRRDTKFGQRERNFQLYRRGRYVEFNLIHDRGTLFGLQSGGRTESILMSLPPQVRWEYCWEPEPYSPEARLYEEYLVRKDWI